MSNHSARPITASSSATRLVAPGRGGRSSTGGGRNPGNSRFLFGRAPFPATRRATLAEHGSVSLLNVASDLQEQLHFLRHPPPRPAGCCKLAIHTGEVYDPVAVRRLPSASGMRAHDLCRLSYALSRPTLHL